ncbi:MAG: hypothetical protein M3Q68_03125, partial [Actinomycetota bacterium]|nr:hypothetical protein [Actinomycetota bacterium]
AIAGHRYRTTVGYLEVDQVDVVDPSSIADGDARFAGYPDVDALVADLRGPPDLPLYRIRFHAVDTPDPRDELAAAGDLGAGDVTDIEARLARLDKASRRGPCTAATLDLIGERPGVRAADLAASVGRETQPFKLDVRKLKALGLTLSLEVGYRLSPRGEAYLRGSATP